MKTLIHRYHSTAVLGGLVIITPFLGIPNFFRNLILVVLGVLIIIFGLTAKRRLGGAVAPDGFNSYQVTSPTHAPVESEEALS